MSQEKYIGMDVHRGHHFGSRDGLCAWAIGRTSPGKRNYSGLDLKTETWLSGRGRTFFLTSLVIELIDEYSQAENCPKNR